MNRGKLPPIDRDKVYGMLTPVALIENRAKCNGLTGQVWSFQCACGKVIKSNAYKVAVGVKIDCGCQALQARRDRAVNVEVGKVYARLTVVKEVEKDRRGHRMFEFSCVCGKSRVYRGHSVLSGRVKSCGCLWYESHRAGQERRIKPDSWSAFNTIFCSYKNSARYRKTPQRKDFEFTRETFRKLIEQPCYYCGDSGSMTTVINKFGPPFVHNGVDRIDSSKGYTIENCVPCCKPCNTAKLDRSIEDFVAWGIRLGDRLRVLKLVEQQAQA